MYFHIPFLSYVVISACINITFANKTKYTCLINPDKILADIYLNMGYLYK